MFQVKKILFPVDFSEACLGASRFVEAFAGRFQAELTLLNVVDLAAYAQWNTAAPLYGTSGIDMAVVSGDQAREEMSKFLAEDLKHLDVKREVVQGDPALQIVAAARQAASDLIMLPSHGLSVFRRFILGSITAKVLHDAECPVWTGVHMENAPALEVIAFRKVLCAVDLSAQSERALGWAAGFAKEHSAELLVAHVVPAAEAGPAKYLDQRFVAEMAPHVREELNVLLKKLNIEARTIVVGGDPAKAVSEIVQSEKVDQLVIGRGAVTGGLGRLRTQSYAMIRSAPCPVVSV
ncbi:MAG: universal stress protein [Acidobacteriota bacterium]